MLVFMKDIEAYVTHFALAVPVRSSGIILTGLKKRFKNCLLDNARFYRVF